jgi:uncharacterized protein
MKALSLFHIGVIIIALGHDAFAFEIRDEADLFGPAAVSRASSKIAVIEKEFGVPILIETLAALPGNLSQNRGSDRVARQAVNELAVQRDRAAGNRGIYILFVKRERVMSNILVPGWLALHLPETRRLAIREAFLEGMRKEPAMGLESGLIRLEEVLGTARAEAGGKLVPAENVPGMNRPATRDRIVAPAQGGGLRGAPRIERNSNGMPILVLIGAVLLVGLIAARMLGNRTRTHFKQDSGLDPGTGMGNGFGPGGPFTGGFPQRGGFLSGLMGGLGGALLGNWIYDRFRGHHHPDASHGTAGGMFGTSDSYQSYGYQYDDIAGAGDAGGLGGDWGDGGGDWGGGDVSGGDFGGGGGDW